MLRRNTLMHDDAAPVTKADEHARRAQAVAEDARVLNRGLVINALGNVAKIATPVLLAFATRAYGVERWGVFVTVQALVLVIVRVAILGFDKALLWFIASRPSEEGERVLAPAFSLVALASCTIALAAALFGEFVLHLSSAASAGLVSLRIMLLGLPLFALTEVQLHACMGKKRMEPQVAVRDTLVPILQVGLAVVLAQLGHAETGLAWSFVLANAAGLLCATFARRALVRARVRKVSLALPPALLRYAIPAGLSDLSNSLLLRADTFVLAALTDAATVGVWGIVSQFGGAIRQIRRAFDPIVVAVSAGIAREHDKRRLVEVISYAAQLVTVTQLPVFAFLFAFADLLAPLYGADFGRGALPVLVLCGFWLLNGAAGLTGVVLSGYGHAGLGLALVWLTLAVQTALLFALVPHFGLVGAALAVGGSYTVQNVVQVIELRRRVGTFIFAPRSLQPLGPASLASLAAAAVVAVLGTAPSWLPRGAAFGAFMLVYVTLIARDYRRGRLRAPGA